MNAPSSDSSTVANPVAALRQYGQSVWLDFIRRSLIISGELKRLVDDDGLGGVTSNPAIFEKAIDGSADYATAIQEISDRHPGLDAKAVYERIAIKDIQDAADVLRPVVRPHRVARRLRQPRSIAGPGERHERHAVGSATALDDGRAAQRDDQGARNDGRAAGDSHADQRRDQRQRDTAVRT
jgi:hypothetical protein